MGRLDGKRAVVTGGASGIGEATARRFIEEGAQVMVVERDERKAARASAMGALFGHADVSIPAQVEAVAELAYRELGGVDVAVAAAGYEIVGDVLELGYEEWDELQAVLVRGVYATFRSVLPGMVEQGSGSLIAVASQLAFVGLERWSSYSAAKAGVVGLVRGIALDYGPRGIRCNALCPGPTHTAMTDRLLAAYPDPDATLAEWSRDMGVFGRLGRPDEVAQGAVFLASDESSFMTGASLVIDGGYTAR